MAEVSTIEWTDATWNIVTGCSIKSPGCRGCYAMELAATRLKNHPSRAGLTHVVNGRNVWNGEVRFNAGWLDQPLRWRRSRRIFVCAHGDLFHEDVPDDWLDQVFAVMALCPHHQFQVLTKRSDRLRAYLTHPNTPVRIGLEALGLCCASIAANPKSALGEGVILRASDINPGALQAWPLPNVWVGVSTEDQVRADERIPDLLATPAAFRFLSVEPMIGSVDLSRFLWGPDQPCADCPKDADCACGYQTRPELGLPALGWVIVGGESGDRPRPMHPDWARGVRDQCAKAGVPFFFKQWGEYLPEGQLSVDQRWASDPVGISSSHGSGEPNTAWPDGKVCWGDSADHGGVGFMLHQVGKKKAGRRLDGAEHSEMPA